MKRLLLETSFSKIYMIVMIIVTLLILGGYFSYAMFTVTKEFTITLSNTNNRSARFNFYYEGELPDGVEVGYKTGEGINTPMEEVGSNLTASGSAGSSNTYKIGVTNNSSSSVTITLGVGVGLDYNDLSLPNNGHLFEKYSSPVKDILLANIGDDGSTYDDGVDTFITGTNPNNYIWYSGKLWRAVSVNNDAKTTKLVTQWGISVGGKDDADKDMWLNDTTIDGFLYNLRDYEEFIVTDSVWDYDPSIYDNGDYLRPDGTNTKTQAVGLINDYEYRMSHKDITGNASYLDIGLDWWILGSRYVEYTAPGYTNSWLDPRFYYSFVMRPSINLKSVVTVVDGDGTIDNPYRLNGDNDTNLSGTHLSSRYSGEYIRFGNNENNLYRIVSHENGSGTKIVSAEPLKSSGGFITSAFGSNVAYSSTNTIGTFLNGEYLTNYVDSTYSNMIEESSTWYLGDVGDFVSYKLAKYTDTSMSGYATSTNAKVGLLRYGELMAGQFDRGVNNTTYWTLTPSDSAYVLYVDKFGRSNSTFPSSNSAGFRPSLNLKSNVEITSGTGTKSDPFILTLGS